MNTPFKFLDAYTKADRAIFFGRDREIEEMYQKVFESKILLIYGISGTGKTSLIECGLANKFEETDWLPVHVRKGVNIVDSLWRELEKVAITPIEGMKGRRSEGEKGRGGEGANGRAGEGASGREEEWEKGRIGKAIQSIYLDHFKPIYLIFDQFEELFIFGSREEREEFIEIVKEIVDSDVQCKIIFSIREEYLASVTEFELAIPDFLSNRMRIEKMTRQHAIEVIEGPCKVNRIDVEEGFAEALLDKLNPEGKEVELTYLQVFLDKVYKMALDESIQRDHSSRMNPGLRMTLSLLGKVGDVSDLLGSFLEEQVGELEDPDTGLVVLKAFVSIQGTKKQINENEISDFARTLGKSIDKEQLTDLLQKFVNLRVLKDKDESGRYELRHDSLATKIYEKITLVEKELLEIKDFLDNAYMNFERRGIYLSESDLKYIAPYEDKLFLNRQQDKFLSDSKSLIERTRRRRRNIVAASAVVLLLIFAGFTIWAMRERKKAFEQKEVADVQREEAVKANQLAVESMQRAEENEKQALLAKDEADEAKKYALNARDIAIRELYENIQSSWAISPTYLNIMYLGIVNKVEISASGISPDKLLPWSEDAKLIKRQEIWNVMPRSRGTIKIHLNGITNFGDTIYLGYREFRIKYVPDPFPTLMGSKGGTITKNDLLKATKIEASMPESFEIEYIQFTVVEFVLGVIIKGFYKSLKSSSAYITSEQKELFKVLHDGNRIYFEDILAVGPDGAARNIGSLIFKIKDIKTSQALEDTSLCIIESIESAEDMFEVLRYYETEQDWNQYFRCVYNALEYFDYWNADMYDENIFKDPELCYYISKTIYSHLPEDSLVLAYNLAFKAMNYDEKPEYCDNYARIAYKVLMPGAIEAEKKAIHLAGEQNMDESGFKSFLAALSNPSGSYYWYDRANFYSENQNLDSAIYFAEKAVKIDQKKPALYVYLGDLFQYKEDFSKSIDCYKKAVSIDSLNLEGWIGLANLTYETDKLGSIEYYKRISELDPSYGAEGYIASAYYDSGMKSYESGNFSESITYFKHYLHYKLDYYVMNMIGIDFLNLHKYDSAAVYLNQAVEGDEGKYLYWSNLAMAYNGLSEYTKSIECCDRSIKLKAGFADVYNHRAYARIKAGEGESALADLQKAMELNPKYDRTYVTLACYYAMKNDYEHAIGNLKKALDQGFRDYEWIESETSFDKIKNEKEFRDLVNNR